MPIFMDRHDLPGLTAMDVAEGHKADLKIQHKYNCRALTYWFDEERGMAFCLIEAPQKEDVEKLHGDSHGLIPNQIIEVEGGVVEAFLGRIKDPEAQDAADFVKLIDPAFRTILLVEFPDAPLLTTRFGAAKGLELLRAHQNIIQQTLRRYDGREARQTRDGLTASFLSTAPAVDCALEIQRRLKARNRQPSGERIHVSIGLSAGDPVSDGNNLFGDTIRLARRLCAVARSDQVLVSTTVSAHYRKERSESLPGGEDLKALTPAEEHFLNRLMDVITGQWNEEGFNVSHLARQMALSKAQLYRKTISLTGRSPNEFIKEFRLKKAMELVEEHSGNISELAYETGFGSPSYFSKCFKKRFGILPSQVSA